jgi:hypothetical protein
METILDWLTGRKCVERKEAQGLDLAIQTIEKFAGRTFRCPETAPKTIGIRSEEILRLIQEELPTYYDYTTRVKEYVNRKGVSQAEIEIVRTLSVLKRYNPLDTAFHIATGTPKARDSHEPPA